VLSDDDTTRATISITKRHSRSTTAVSSIAGLVSLRLEIVCCIVAFLGMLELGRPSTSWGIVVVN